MTGRAGIWISGGCQVTVNDEPLPISPATAGNAMASFLICMQQASAPSW